MVLIKTIKSIGKEHWATAILFIVFAIFFGAGPMWVNAIVGSFLKPFNIYSLIDGGQLIILSAALVASGVYFVGKDYKKTVFPGRLVFLGILLAVWMVVCVIFTFIILSGRISFLGLTVQWETIRMWSYILLGVSLLVVFIAAAINEYRTQIHYYTLIWEKGTGKLEHDFDNMPG